MSTVGRLMLAESVGTFALVFFGCGAIMVDARDGGLGVIGIALAFGVVIAAMVAMLGHVSGAHFNPAVTLALAARRAMPASLIPPYLAAQLVGATAAALTLRTSLGLVGNLGATTPSGSVGQAFLWETVMSAALVGVVLAVATDRRATGHPVALIVGGTVALCALVGGPVSGASMNPARTLAPMFAGGPGDGLWIYLTAPFLGAAIALALFTAFRTEKS
jgi:aquaporin NIP